MIDYADLDHDIHLMAAYETPWNHLSILLTF